MPGKIPAILIGAAVIASGVNGQGTPPPEELAEVEILEWRVANPEPVGTYAQAISELRLEPLVDLQSRNFAEAQGDIAIRGGIFEGTALRVGSAVLPDPQTGHYTAELPVPASMLGRVAVHTGFEHGVMGTQATAGTLGYALLPVREGGVLEAGAGTDDAWQGSLHAGWAGKGDGGGSWGWDLGLAASSGDGTRAGGKHRFERAAGRVTWQGAGGGQTQLLAGYQSKYFEWPYLYALRALHELVGSSGVESEALQTLLVLADHRVDREWGGWGATAFFRRHRDDYEFDVGNPGLFNPFKHETRVGGLGVSLDAGKDRWQWQAAAQVMADAIDSTALRFGPFSSRAYASVRAVGGYRLGARLGESWIRAGAVLDWTDRDGAALSGLLQVEGARAAGEGRLSWHLGYAGATRVPGYTAIAGNPDGGLFRGNPDLGRERSHNLEASARWSLERFWMEGTLFHRLDDDLVDWVFNAEQLPSFSRQAENVDIDTTGVELRAAWRAETGMEIQAAYAWLGKSEDYGRPDVDASFYALNFPEHRLFAGLVAPVGERLELRMDGEWREQEANALRSGSDTALFLHAALGWRPLRDGPLELRLAADNLTDEAFEDVPGVPGAGRQVMLSGRVGF